MSYLQLNGQDPVWSGSNPTPTAIQRAIDAAQASIVSANGKTAQNSAGLEEVLRRRTGETRPELFSKDDLYFGGANYDGYLGAEGQGLLIREEKVVDDLNTAIRKFGAETKGSPAYAATTLGLSIALKAAQDLLVRWKWYELKGSTPSNPFDAAAAYVEEGKRELKSALGLPPDRPILPDIQDAILYLKWAVGIIVGLQVLSAMRK